MKKNQSIVWQKATVKVVEPGIITICRIGAIVFSALFVVSVVMWILKVKKFKKTEDYANYKEFKKNLKEAKKSK